MKKLFASLMIIGLSLVFVMNVNAQTANANVSDVSAGAQSVVIFPEPLGETTIHTTGQRPFGQAPYFVGPTIPGNVDTNGGPGAMFLSIKTMLPFKNTFTYDELFSMNEKQFGTKTVLNLIVKKSSSAPAITFAVAEENGIQLPGDYNYQFVGFGFVRATHEHASSAEILSDLGRNALQDYGVNYAVALSEGVERSMIGSGYTISAGYNTFNMSSNELSMGIGGIGAGYGKGAAGMRALPYLKFACYIRTPKVEKTAEGPKPGPATPVVEKKVETKDVPWYKRNTLL